MTDKDDQHNVDAEAAGKDEAADKRWDSEFWGFQDPDRGYVVVLGGDRGDWPELPPGAPPGSRLVFDTVNGWVVEPPESGPTMGSPDDGPDTSPGSGVPSHASRFGDIVTYNGIQYVWDGNYWNVLGGSPVVIPGLEEGNITIHNGEPWIFLDGEWSRDHTYDPQPSPHHEYDVGSEVWIEIYDFGSVSVQPGTVRLRPMVPVTDKILEDVDRITRLPNDPSDMFLDMELTPPMNPDIAPDRDPDEGPIDGPGPTSVQHPDFGPVLVLGGDRVDAPELPADSPPGSRLEFDSVHGWIVVPPESKPAADSPDGGTPARFITGRPWLLPILGVIAIGVLGILFVLTRGGDSDVSTSGDSQSPEAASATVAPSVPATDPPAPTTAVTADADPTPDVLADPLFIVLSDGSQYPVWALEDDTGTLTYVLQSPTRDGGCLLIGYGPNDADAVGVCTITQIGSSRPATILYMADDGSVLVELRNSNSVQLTDEIGFAQSAVVGVEDAPVVVRTNALLVFGQEYRSI